jgi:prepilin signal peptidase PulO-like enzyme (type II secretory pathway)
MLLTTMMLVWIMSRLGFTWHGAVYAAWFSGLLVLACIDLRHFLLPDVLTVGLLGLALLARVAGFGSVSWINALFGAILGYAVLWSLNALYRRFRGFDGFGGGDLKMMAALGGWFGASGVVDVLTLASLLALVPAAILRGVGAQRVSLQTAIPFGPFLAIAAAGLTIMRFEGEVGSFTALS